MDTTTIVLLLAGIVAVSIVIIVFTQMRERARIEQARKITAQQDAYKRASRLLSELPGQYLTADLKLLLIKRMEEACSALAALKSNLPVKEWQKSTAELKTQVIEKRDSTTPTKIDSAEKSNYINELLQNLFKMIEAMHKSGRIDSATAKKNLKYVLFLIHKSHADLHVFQARDHVRQNQIRKAINSYHLASTEMGKSSDNPLAMKAVKSFRTRIKELEAMMLEGSESPQGESKLDREWDTFLDDDEWKKKADYDD